MDSDTGKKITNQRILVGGKVMETLAHIALIVGFILLFILAAACLIIFTIMVAGDPDEGTDKIINNKKE